MQQRPSRDSQEINFRLKYLASCVEMESDLEELEKALNLRDW